MSCHYATIIDDPNYQRAVLRSELVRDIMQLRAKKLQRLLDLAAKANFNPAQPRVPAGNSDGGQWTNGGGISAGRQAFRDYLHGRVNGQPRVQVADSGAIMNDASEVNINGSLSVRYKGEKPPYVPPSVDINANMKEAATHKLNFWWFRNQVHNKGPWDYKQLNKIKYEAFGNFHYGAVGRAAGFSEATLLRAAGWAHVDAGNKGGSGTPPMLPQVLLGVGGIAPFGDDPVDQLWISRGFRYYNAIIRKSR